MTATVLVTGGAGYIGSHIVQRLGVRGERTVVLDDLSTGFAEAVFHGDLVIGDVGDRETVARILREYKVQCVMHLAARSVVPESIEQPLAYYQSNASAVTTLLDCCRTANVRQFIFSSTAAVYGAPNDGIVDENTPPAPINPYGRSKLVAEWMLRDSAASHDIRFVTLRYFNVAGCHSELGQRTAKATLLIKVAAEVAVGHRPKLSIFGDDHPTEDGTGVRDYIHVEDIATAHIAALDYLRRGGDSTTLNCGYGRGSSVRDVIRAVERTLGRSLPVQLRPRRQGDPARLVAQANLIRKRLDWQPRFDDLDLIVRSSIDWERKQFHQR